jgi:hypothetical protein
VVLERGYLEFLTPIGDTSVATQLRMAIKRYVGVHSIVFGTNTPDEDYARLEKAGFAPLPPIALQRETATEREAQTVRFTVVRTPPGTMAEGRIQFCLHHTPHLVWQERWLTHPNRAVGLNGVVVCVSDPAETAQRYTRYTGILAQSTGSAWRMTTARGWILFVDPAALKSRLDIEPPSLPWIAGYAVESADIAATAAHLRRSDLPVEEAGARKLVVKAPPDIGGFIIFEPANSSPLSLG